MESQVSTSSTPTPIQQKPKLKKYVFISCLGCTGMSVILVVVIAITGWSIVSNASKTVQEAHQLWQQGKKELAVGKYREIEYGDGWHVGEQTHSTIYQRCIEFEWSKGDHSVATALIQRAVDQEVALNFSDKDIQTVVAQRKEEFDKRIGEKKQLERQKVEDEKRAERQKKADKKKGEQTEAIHEKNDKLAEINAKRKEVLDSIDDTTNRRVASFVLSYYQSGDDTGGDGVIRDNPGLWAYESKLKKFRDYCRERGIGRK